MNSRCRFRKDEWGRADEITFLRSRDFTFNFFLFRMASSAKCCAIFLFHALNKICFHLLPPFKSVFSPFFLFPRLILPRWRSYNIPKFYEKKRRSEREENVPSFSFHPKDLISRGILASSFREITASAQLLAFASLPLLYPLSGSIFSLFESEGALLAAFSLSLSMSIFLTCQKTRTFCGALVLCHRSFFFVPLCSFTSCPTSQSLPRGLFVDSDRLSCRVVLTFFILYHACLNKCKTTVVVYKTWAKTIRFCHGCLSSPRSGGSHGSPEEMLFLVSHGTTTLYWRMHSH